MLSFVYKPLPETMGGGFLEEEGLEWSPEPWKGLREEWAAQHLGVN